MVERLNTISKHIASFPESRVYRVENFKKPKQNIVFLQGVLNNRKTYSDILMKANVGEGDTNYYFIEGPQGYVPWLKMNGPSWFVVEIID